jgi:DNA-binding XRE family transcriptional regulator
MVISSRMTRLVSLGRPSKGRVSRKGKRSVEEIAGEAAPQLTDPSIATCSQMPYILHRKCDIRYGKVALMAEALKVVLQSESLVLSYMDRAGRIAINQLADGFGMSKTQLAETAGLARETLYRVERSRAPRTQGRLREMLEIISRVTEWAGGKEQAMAWYRAQPLPAFGGRTAEALVKEGKAAAVRDYLDHMALGGFA